MNKFHRRCGDRVTLLNNNLTAIRNFVEFNHGLILSADPLVDDALFEIRIDRKVNVWNGSLEIGVTTLDPEFMELPATATKLRNTAWILSGNSIVKDGVTIVNVYGPELDTLREGDTIGVTRTSKGELMFFINGRCLGVAAKDLPPRLFAVIDLYGQCVQVSIIHNNTRPMLDTFELQEYGSVATAYVPGEAQPGTSTDPKLPTVSYISVPISCPLVSQDHIRFHPRCGILVKLSANNKTAERARPLDDYNNGVVMTHRPLYDNELFVIRIDKLVDKWSGSIEVGVTTHNPATIRFPSTMTNMDSGTIMMSGCKVLLNGHGTAMEYGNFNLDELREGDTVGMMRKSNGKLHYFINGIDQGVATDKVAPQVWGVIDLYGMTVKVTIIDPCEDMDTNIHNLPIRMLAAPELPSLPRPPRRPQIDQDALLFHSVRDSNVIVINHGKTAHRPNAFEYFNNGVVMTNRTLKTNELFQVRLDLIIPKWAGGIEIGVTIHSSKDLKFPFKLCNAKSGTWAVSGEDVLRDGNVIIPQYVRNLGRLMEGETVGVMRKDMGILHFFVNGIDQGPAAFNIPEHVFGIVDLYGRVAQATVLDPYAYAYAPLQIFSPESPMSTESNATVYPEMCFHRVHGRNARLSRNRLTASRATVYSEFNDAVLFSSRPLRECDMFELRIDKMVDCWIGSLEIGVTAIRPDDLDVNGGVGAIAGTATDLSWDTYILSGAAMMKDGECVRSGYPLDLDTLTVGSRVGMMWHADRSLHYYLDGMDMGKAWYVPHLNIYAVIDLYGQCTQVTILQNDERTFNYNGCNSDQTIPTNPRVVTTPQPPYWSFSEYFGENIILSKDYLMAKRRLSRDPMGALVFSSTHLIVGEIYEIKILECKQCFAGSFRMGVTDVNILNAYVNRNLPLSVSWLPHYTAYVDGKYLKYSKPGTEEQELRSFVPSFEWLRPGDRVGLKKTNDSRVIIYYNSEPLELAIENVPDKVYVVMEMYGNVTKIETVTRGTNVTAATHQQTIPNDNMSQSEPQRNVETSADPDTLTEAETKNESDMAAANVTTDAIGEASGSGTANAVANEPANASATDTANAGASETANASANEPANAGANETANAGVNEIANASANENANASANENANENENEIANASANENANASANAPAPIADNVGEQNRNRNGPKHEFGPSRDNPEAQQARPNPMRRVRSLPYTFHYIHGRHIRLCSSETVAMRFRGHAHGVAIASQPLRRGHQIRFRIDRMTNQWKGTASIGAMACLPSETPPRTALHIDSTCWIVTDDVLYAKGLYTQSEVGNNLSAITVNSVLTLCFNYNSELWLDVDGKTSGTIAVIPKYHSQIFPVIDLYGKVTQVSILLHPSLITGGTSLDLPMIQEHEELMVDQDGAGTLASSYESEDDEPDPRQDTRFYNNHSDVSQASHHAAADLSPQPGPSTLPHGFPFPSHPRDNDAKNKEIKCRCPLSFKISLHHSLMLPDDFCPLDNDEAARAIGIQKSHSTQNFSPQQEDSDDDDGRDSLINALSLGSRIIDDDDDDDSSEILDLCDTNIRHNDRFPEANDVDILDNELMIALTMETGNLPDLTEEQSPSIDESTRRDDLWSDGLSVENLYYLNGIICWDPDTAGPRFAERDWVFFSETNGNCEHMHMALKFWNHFVYPYPIMSEVVASGQVRCYCGNCTPQRDIPYMGWVRIERANARSPSKMFWHVVRSTLVSAQSVAGERGIPRRPQSLAPEPTILTNASQIWMDEEGKPHHAIVALEIDIGDALPENDRLLAYMIFLKSRATFVEDFTAPFSFEEF